jgi:hypothetical protein
MYEDHESNCKVECFLVCDPLAIPGSHNIAIQLIRTKHMASYVCVCVCVCVRQTKKRDKEGKRVCIHIYA